MDIFTLLGLIALVAGILVVWSISSYNGLVSQRSLVDEGWSGIDVQLKRRADLVPNLIAVVKQYQIHERDVLEKVTQMRSIALDARSIDQKAEAEKGLTGALKTLFAVTESYPDLKANQNFIDLQKQLSVLETEIQLARRYYNGAARNYNVSVQSFPGNMVAQFFSFSPVAYFEIDSADRNHPGVKF